MKILYCFPSRKVESVKISDYNGLLSLIQPQFTALFFVLYYFLFIPICYCSSLENSCLQFKFWDILRALGMMMSRPLSSIWSPKLKISQHGKLFTCLTSFRNSFHEMVSYMQRVFSTWQTIHLFFSFRYVGIELHIPV